MKALEGFKTDAIEVLVATDVAARGLDIVELPVVINYDVPFAAEDYIHRIGRTGRAGMSGLTIMLMTGSEERAVTAIEKLTKQKFQIRTLNVTPQPRAQRSDHRERPVRRDALDRRPERAYTPAAAPVDDFFSKPYQASAPDAAKVEAPKEAATSPSQKPTKVAALLGGTRR